METTRFGMRLKTQVSDALLSLQSQIVDGGPITNRFYIELWTANGALVGGETFQKHVLEDEVYQAEPVKLSVQDAERTEGRPTVRVLVFENKTGGGNELFRHEHRFFGECGRWHYVSH